MSARIWKQRRLNRRLQQHWDTVGREAFKNLIAYGMALVTMPAREWFKLEVSE